MKLIIMKFSPVSCYLLTLGPDRFPQYPRLEHPQGISVMKTNQVHYLAFIYFGSQPLHVSGVFIAHHQEVFTVYLQQLVCVMR
jgi:hypothetical protein